MFRKCALVVTGLALLVGSLAAAYQPADTKKEKATTKEPRKLITRGEPYTVVSVNVEKKTAVVKNAKGERTVSLGEGVNFVGPFGGEAKGIKDDRLAAGSTVRLVFDGDKVKEVVLSVRKADPTKKKDAPKKTTKKKTDDKKTDEKKADDKKDEKKEDKKTDDKKDEKKKKSTKKKADDKKTDDKKSDK